MSELKLTADSGGGSVSFKGPATTTSNAAVQLTLPVNDGDANQVLTTNGSGALSWAAPVITDDSITEAKLDVSNAPTNGQFLQAQSGEGGGLTWAASGGRKYTYGSWVATNSGTEVEFTSLPSLTSGQFAIDWHYVGLGANEELGCLIGDSGGYETSGYHNITGYCANSTAAVDTSTSRWETEGTASSVQHRSGRMLFWNIKDSNEWFMDSMFYVDSEPALYFWKGMKTLSATLDRVKFYGVSGASFDQGHMRLVTIEDL